MSSRRAEAALDEAAEVRRRRPLPRALLEVAVGEHEPPGDGLQRVDGGVRVVDRLEPVRPVDGRRHAGVERLDRRQEVARVDVLRAEDLAPLQVEEDEVLAQRPVGAVAAQRRLPHVPVRVDHPRHDDAVGRVDLERALGRLEAGTDRGDPVAVDQDVRVAQDLVRVVHRQHGAPSQNHRPAGLDHLLPSLSVTSTSFAPPGRLPLALPGGADLLEREPLDVDDELAARRVRGQAQVALAPHVDRRVRDREAAEVERDRPHRRRRQRQLEARDLPDLDVARPARGGADRGQRRLAPERVDRDVDRAAGRVLDRGGQVARRRAPRSRRRRARAAAPAARSAAPPRPRGRRRAASPPGPRRCRRRRSRRAPARSRPAAAASARRPRATRRARCCRARPRSRRRARRRPRTARPPARAPAPPSIRTAAP